MPNSYNIAIDLIADERPQVSFSSKADVLSVLEKYPDLHIPPFCSFTVKEWKSDPENILSQIREKLGQAGALAVRSSCRREDSESSSAAGRFLSVLHVEALDEAALTDAIGRVIASYDEASPDDQVLAQAMVRNPQVTGVIMTRVLNDGSPYHVINYDDESGATDSITGGVGVQKTVYVYRGVREQDFDSPRLRSFVAFARRVEELCGWHALDIEFCLDADKLLHLLQARPISARKNWPENSALVHGFIDNVARFVGDVTGPAPGMFGQRSILGVMPDWNPAEMIGILPKPLSISLYRYLITSNVWSKARKRMGYRALPATELMYSIMGRPYIDVRASFNSFLPAGLGDSTSEALVSAWLDRLEAMPRLHDKIEFEIAQTSLDFCFDEHMKARYASLLDAKRCGEFRDALRNLTQNCLNMTDSGSMHAALEAVSGLRGRQAQRPLPLEGARPPLSAAAQLLDECREYGTLPFSVLARHAFIAESLLRSSVQRGALSEERLAVFKASIQTVSGELSADFMKVCNGQSDPRHFMRKYGHLRPGSYDMLSPRYVDRKDLFDSSISMEMEEKRPFVLEDGEKGAIASLLRESRLALEPEQLLRYAERAISGREYAKFVFTRNLSDVLEILAGWGEGLGFGREDVVFMDLRSILDHKISVVPEDPAVWFANHAEMNKKLHENARHLKLGYLICSVRDVYIAPQHRSAPNFIGHRRLESAVLILANDTACDVDLSGKIVCVENADPGFDWIFTRNIGGLVTKFGGANSHMAIRCAEYGLPAAIGVGESLYESVSHARTVFLDPASAILKVQS